MSESIIISQARAAKSVSQMLGTSSTNQRNNALHIMADALIAREKTILQANQKDIEVAREKGTRENLIDRLFLDKDRLAACADALRDLAGQNDPLGEVIDGRTIAGGIQMKQIRVPLGVVGMIYEARPNVTCDACGIGVKTGNAMLLRGGSMAAHSNKALVEVLQDAIETAGFSRQCLQPIDATSRETAKEMMHLTGLIDVLIPRGGAGLIASVVKNSKVPVIETGTGNCHVYIEKTADIEMAKAIVLNAKCQRPSVCNAAESLLVDREIVGEVIKTVLPALVAENVELAVDQPWFETISHAVGNNAIVTVANEDDWAQEYLDMKISVKVVTGVEEAVKHINTYGTKHSEAIITSDYEIAQYFTTHTDASAVYVNASTRFTDGGMFGLGAEIGISTQKLHARGPMGLTALTSTKFICEGQGQIR